LLLRTKRLPSYYSPIYNLILIEEAMGTSYTGKNGLFPSRNMWG
jgi:hypothetical protein